MASQNGEGGEDDDVLLAIIGGIDPGDDLVIDCLISDNHTFDAEVTDFPVESGSTISDNIRNKPLVVTMDCLVTNTPIGQVVNFRNKDEDPVDTAYNAMIKIRNARKPVSIRTSLKTYKNMALQNLSVPRESGRGDELRFTATFKQVEFVVNRRDTRVAIVGAKSGGVREFHPTADTSTDNILVHMPDQTWFDGAIGGWRHSVHFPTVTNVRSSNNVTTFDNGTFEAGEKGLTKLHDDRPIDIPAKVFDNERVDQHTIPLLRARLKAIHATNGAASFQGGNILFKHNPNDMIELHKGEFVIIRLE